MFQFDTQQMIRRNNNMENKRINRDLTSILKCRCDYIVNCFGTILDEVRGITDIYY